MAAVGMKETLPKFLRGLVHSVLETMEGTVCVLDLAGCRVQSVTEEAENFFSCELEQYLHRLSKQFYFSPETERLFSLQELNGDWQNRSLFLCPQGKEQKEEVCCILQRDKENSSLLYLIFYPVRTSPVRPQISAQMSEKQPGCSIRPEKKECFQEERNQIVIRQIGASVFEWSEGRNYISSEILETFAISADKDILMQLGTPPLLYAEDTEKFEKFRRQLKSRKENAELVCRLLTKAGNYRWYRIVITAIQGKNHQITRAVGSILDVDEKVKSMQELKYKTEYDTLTGIYNLEKFCRKAEKLMRHSPENRYAVVVMNVERFKIINDQFGQEVGNDALRYIAQELKKHAEGWVYARLQADEFCMVVPYQAQQEVVHKIQQLHDALQHFREDCPICTRFGIYDVEDPCMPATPMVDRARLAADSSKGDAVQPYTCYQKGLMDRLQQEQQIQLEAEYALENGEFEVFLQPKYNLSQHYVCGAEALVRWRHPVRGMISPNAFIPMMECNGMILRLDQYVWEETVKILARWKAEHKAMIPISVNVSRRHVRRTALLPYLTDLLERYQIPKTYLHLELTESVLVENKRDIMELMASLRNAGFVLEMDDFGSGYSSLNILRDVPVDFIKLDKEFLDETLAGPRGQIVVQNVLHMAKDLGLSVVAEGVETDEQMMFLNHVNCDMIQGYFIAKPMEINDFEQFTFATDLTPEGK